MVHTVKYLRYHMQKNKTRLKVSADRPEVVSGTSPADLAWQPLIVDLNQHSITERRFRCESL